MIDLWRDFWIRETGTGQQVAQLHEIYMMMIIIIITEVHLNAREKIPFSYRLNADVRNGPNKLFISVRVYYHRKRTTLYALYTKQHNKRNNFLTFITTHDKQNAYKLYILIRNRDISVGLVTGRLCKLAPIANIYKRFISRSNRPDVPRDPHSLKFDVH